MLVMERRATERPIVDSIDVYIAAADPVSRAGTASQLRAAPGIRVVEEGRVSVSTVALVVADEVDEDAARRDPGPPAPGCGTHRAARRAPG